ncbi:MAG: sugar phosphate isomerase/epimerase [Planctomycetes bacterium]|nr:sugar phosphate isomerase/epimerase [Planctomycetota bacterium]
MVLTLSVGSLRPLMKRAKKPLDLFELPTFVSEEMGLRGLNIPSDLLAGRTPSDIARLCDLSDKAHCPFLVLIESPPLDLWSPENQAVVLERLRRLAAAATRLGCSSLAVTPLEVTTPERVQAVARTLKLAMVEMDRFEINLLLQSAPGLLSEGKALIDLVKKVGSFRIGSMPSFQHAAAHGGVSQELRKLAPYAQSITASVKGFSATGEHADWSLDECVEILRAVGYVNSLSLEYMGKGDPIKPLGMARDMLSAAIEAAEPA